ncbi:phosphoribosylamine--glycine ligase [Granulicella arctica]|uniref:Phosphoribosylamine--glycine ligase n=1 Tax=Granulicella arctica TaxID=940613 RepID=A0A7Y9PEG7_9BACT|nr:phosphoribosylamine--glycine ligase [Granulicella arctica]NYF78427.1 phosphoribosylamine--glycine ligase [Granulicella arctica]
MKVLVIGGGGREHAIAWALRKSPRVTEVVCAPGNGGIAREARCVPVDVSNLAAMVALVQGEAPALTIVGPELPLSLGLVDQLQSLGLRVFGPTQAAARLESSKAFAKSFMQRTGIPTAAYALCTSLDEVRRELKSFAAPIVVKADGLAAGKGVVICNTHHEAEAAAAEMFSGALLGAAVDEIVLEEFLTGDELSFFALCDGKHAVPLAAAQDHKRIGEGDTGPNTGGMGAYSTDALMPPALRDWLNTRVAQRVVDEMAAAGTPFTGILFCGIMMVPDPNGPVLFGRGPVSPMVLEFNTRFGDPETQAILMRLETDILDLFEAAIDGRADRLDIQLKPGAAACVIAASGGYPGKYPSGLPITGEAALHNADPSLKVFHSGTALTSDETFVTAGGRVLAVTAVSTIGLKEALGLAYDALGKLSFDGMQYRRDIGWRAL